MKGVAVNMHAKLRQVDDLVRSLVVDASKSNRREFIPLLESICLQCGYIEQALGADGPNETSRLSFAALTPVQPQEIANETVGEVPAKQETIQEAVAEPESCTSTSNSRSNSSSSSVINDTNENVLNKLSTLRNSVLKLQRQLMAWDKRIVSGKDENISEIDSAMYSLEKSIVAHLRKDWNLLVEMDEKPVSEKFTIEYCYWDCFDKEVYYPETEQEIIDYRHRLSPLGLQYFDFYQKILHIQHNVLPDSFSDCCTDVCKLLAGWYCDFLFEFLYSLGNVSKNKRTKVDRIVLLEYSFFKSGSERTKGAERHVHPRIKELVDQINSCSFSPIGVFLIFAYRIWLNGFKPIGPTLDADFYPGLEQPNFKEKILALFFPMFRPNGTLDSWTKSILLAIANVEIRNNLLDTGYPEFRLGIGNILAGYLQDMQAHHNPAIRTLTDLPDNAHPPHIVKRKIRKLFGMELCKPLQNPPAIPERITFLNQKQIEQTVQQMQAQQEQYEKHQFEKTDNDSSLSPQEEQSDEKMRAENPATNDSIPSPTATEQGGFSGEDDGYSKKRSSVVVIDDEDDETDGPQQRKKKSQLVKGGGGLQIHPTKRAKVL